MTIESPALQQRYLGFFDRVVTLYDVYCTQDASLCNALCLHVGSACYRCKRFKHNTHVQQHDGLLASTQFMVSCTLTCTDGAMVGEKSKLQSMTLEKSHLTATGPSL
jgi:hypothetical protein